MGSGKLVFGRLAIVHRDHDGIGLLGQTAGATVVNVAIGEHPAAAVEVEDDREGTLALGGVDAGGQHPGGAIHGTVDAGHAGYQASRLGGTTLVLQEHP